MLLEPRMPPDAANQSQTPPLDLKPAAENPWYVLATIYGEPHEERPPQENAAIHAKNRRIWNGWIYNHLSTAQRAELEELGELVEIDEPSLAPLSAEQAAMVEQAFTERGLLLPASSVEMDFRAVSFDVPLNMAGFFFFGKLDFSGSHFHSYCSFSGSLFYRGVNFARNQFNGNLYFDMARFRCNFSIDNTNFLHLVSFSNAEIDKTLSFKRSSFESEISLRYATMKQNAELIFVDCDFIGFSEFHRVTSAGLAKITNCRFANTVSFDEAGFATLDLLDSSFNSRIYFSGCTIYNLTIKSCKFEDEAIFSPTPRGGLTIPTMFFENLVISNTKFSKNVAFNGIEFFGPVIFDNTTLESDIDFDDVRFNLGVLFKRTNFYGFSNFRGAIFDNEVSFTDCHFDRPATFRRAHFKRRFPNFSGAILHPNTAFSAHQDFWPEHDEISDEAAEESRQSLAIIRHTVGKQGLPEDEHYFFRREMAFAALIGGTWRRLPYRAFGLLSDFGESIAKPTVWLLVVWLFGFFAYLYWFLRSGEPLSDSSAEFTAAGFSIAQLFSFLGFNRIFFEGVAQKLPVLLQVIAGFQTVAGVVLLFLLGLGLRNRFRLK